MAPFDLISICFRKALTDEDGITFIAFIVSGCLNTFLTLTAARFCIAKAKIHLGW
jgi:hypothetical protein